MVKINNNQVVTINNNLCKNVDDSVLYTLMARYGYDEPDADYLEAVYETVDTSDYHQYLMVADEFNYITVVERTLQGLQILGSFRELVRVTQSWTELQSNNLTFCQWQNTGMSNQPLYTFKVDADLPKSKQVLRNAIGDIVVYSADGQLTFLLHSERDYSEVTIGKSHIRFESIYESDVAELNGCTNDRHDSLARMFVQTVCEIHNEGLAEVFAPIQDQLYEYQKNNKLHWHFDTNMASDTHEECTWAFSEEFTNKAHLEDDCIFCYSWESAQELVAEGVYTNTDFSFEEVIELYPDGDYSSDLAIVVRKGI